MSDTFQPAPVKPPISKAAFDALDIRVGRIEAVSDVAGSDKLVALTVNFGDHTRTIIAGIKLERDAAALVGRQSLFVVNMEPRKMRGAVSEGMLFDIGYADGIVPALAVPEREVPNGARAG
jgi:methionine--tRNA ligase beta chain